MTDIDTRYGHNNPAYISEKLYWIQVNNKVNEFIVINPISNDVDKTEHVSYTCTKCRTAYYYKDMKGLRECPFCGKEFIRKEITSMPVNTSRPCKNKQCTHITRDASGYCLVCRPIYNKPYAQYDKTRPTSRQRGYTGNWDNFRKLYLRQNPLCSCGQAATLVHHIVPLVDGGEMYNGDNLMPMCRVCHEMIHNRKK